MNEYLTLSKEERAVVDELAAEGESAGAAPWCASSIIEMIAAERLSKRGIHRRETMDETRARRGRGRQCPGCHGPMDNKVLPVCGPCWNRGNIPQEFQSTDEEAAECVTRLSGRAPVEVVGCSATFEMATGHVLPEAGVALATLGCARHGTLAVVPAVDWNRAALLLHRQHINCSLSASLYYRAAPTTIAEALAMAAAVSR